MTEAYIARDTEVPEMVVGAEGSGIKDLYEYGERGANRFKNRRRNRVSKDQDPLAQLLADPSISGSVIGARELMECYKGRSIPFGATSGLVPQ